MQQGVVLDIAPPSESVWVRESAPTCEGVCACKGVRGGADKRTGGRGHTGESEGKRERTDGRAKACDGVWRRMDVGVRGRAGEGVRARAVDMVDRFVERGCGM